MNTAVGTPEQELLIPNLFQEQGVDQFKGAENDTISMKVEGILPFHDYAWRNDRSNPIVFDENAGRTIAVTFGRQPVLGRQAHRRAERLRHRQLVEAPAPAVQGRRALSPAPGPSTF